LVREFANYQVDLSDKQYTKIADFSPFC